MRALPPPNFYFFFFNDTATTEIYTLSLHDALPISSFVLCQRPEPPRVGGCESRERPLRKCAGPRPECPPDRKSTRLNSSHGYISYAVFCLKKKKKNADATPNISHPY